MKPFIDRHCPRSTKEIIGQDEPLRKLSLFIRDFKSQKKKAALIYGPSGSGKTSAVYAIAHEHNLEIIEVNASDFRNAEGISSIVGGAIGQQSLFFRKKLILIDEIDGLAGNQDRGGVQELVRQIESTTFPIVLTATNPFDNKLSSLRSKSSLIEFSELSPATITAILKTICGIEKIIYDEDSLKTLARRAGGDARAAINNLQVISIISKAVTKEAVEELSDRDRTETIISALQKILKTTSLEVALKAFDAVDEDVNERMLWLDENLPKEYINPADLARAYDALSKADVFNRRIRRWQHYRFLVYANAFLSGGVAVAKDEKYPGFVEYKPTGRILKLWWAKQKSMKKKAIAEKIAERTHTSAREALKSTMPYFTYLFSKNKALQPKLIEELDLDEEEVGWLKKTMP